MIPQTNLSLQTDWLEDEKILRYTVFTANMQMMQEWSLGILAALRHWEAEKPIRLLFDLSHPNVSMSYFVLSGRNLFNLGILASAETEALNYIKVHPKRPVKLAVLLSTTMLGTLSKYIPARQEHENFHAKIYFGKEAAQTWLLANFEAQETNTGVVTSDQMLKDIGKIEVEESDYFGERQQIHLIVNDSLEVLPIDERRPIIVGRHPKADLNLLSYGELAQSVSRYHAQISLNNGRLSIIDLNSRNGTLLSGRQLEAGKAAFIRREDIISIGKIEIKVVF